MEAVLDDMLTIGIAVRDFVLRIAGLLVNPAAPGVVTLALLALLLVAGGLYGGVVWQRARALGWMRARVAGLSGGGALDRVSAAVAGATGRSAARGTLSEAWTEYAETLVREEGLDGAVTLRNAVRPGLFFNTEDLHFGPGFWRVVPGLFVMVGLFLTFLGLIAALAEMNLGTQAEVQQSLRALMAVASAKFIMSLTGLFCSIVFTVVLRVGMGRIDRQIHLLCGLLERRLTFISLEEVTVRQLRAIRAQQAEIRALGSGLAAEIGRPMREELPAAISTSIATSMAPLLDRVGTAGVDGMGAMVQELSARFSGDIGRALTDASARIGEAGDRIGQLVDRMDRSSGRMGSEVEAASGRMSAAVEDLRGTMAESADRTASALSRGVDHLLSVMNQTLEGIRDNTGSGARAMAEAAGSLRGAAEAFRAEISAASREASDAARIRLAEAGAEASGAVDAAGREMLAAVDRTGAGMDAAVERLARAVESIQLTMGTSAETASGALTRGADHLLSVMNQTLEGIRDNTGSGARAMAEAAGSLRGAAEAFRAEISAASREASDAARTRLAEAGAEASGAVDAAGREMLEAVGRTGAEMMKATEAITEKTSAGLLAPLDRVADVLRDFSTGIEGSTADLRRLTDGMRAGAEAAGAAAGSLRSATRDLTGAGQPLRGAHERIERAVRQYTDSATSAATVVTRSSEETARRAAQALATAEQLLGGHGRSIEATLAELARVIERLKGQGTRLDDLDEKLGRAFDVYTDRVGVAVDGLYGHVKHMQAELAPALDVLNTVVAQAENFVPERRRG